ncbi:hypothetical protein [Acinetobacter soli]|uniref:hypothetical protein n=1 Tax=Acinetobacter soli TaxID=487316 RepID=UPI002D80DA24|nr:hypothetical protein [Acinetobacter soli]MEB4800675.1 hypothetical protein [Acinetobacter soli]
MRIPQLQSQVSEAQTPSVRIQGGISPGEAVQMANNQSKDLLAVADTYMQYQNTADKARAAQINSEMQNSVNNFLYNPKEGLLNIKGENALTRQSGMTLVDEAEQWFKNLADEKIGTLSTENQRKLFNQNATALKGQLNRITSQHLFNESQKFQKNAFESEIDANSSSINMNYSDDKTTIESLSKMKKSITDYGKTLGWSDSQIEAFAKEQHDKALIGAINLMQTNGDSQVISSYFNKYKDLMSASSQAKVGKLIENNNADIFSANIIKYKDDPEELDKYITALGDPNSPFYKQVGARNVPSLLGRAVSYRDRYDKAQAAQIKKINDDGKKALGDFKDDVKSGMPFTASRLTELQQRIQGTDSQKEFEIINSNLPTFQKLYSMPSDQRETFVNAYEAKAKTKPTDNPQDVKLIVDQMKSIHTSMLDKEKNDPTLAYSLKTGNILIQAPTSNIIQGDVRALNILSENITTMDALNKSQGSQTGNLNPLSKQNIDEMNQFWKSAAPKQRLQLITNLFKASQGNTAAAKNMIQSVAGDNNAYRWAASLNNRGLTDIATQITTGQDLIDKSEVKISDNALRVKTTEYLKGIVAEGTPAFSTYYQAIRANYAYLAQKSEKLTDKSGKLETKNVDTELFNLAALNVTGGKFSTGGFFGNRNTVLRPHTVSEASFKDQLETFNSRYSREYGGTDKDYFLDLPLEQDARNPNVYYFKEGARYVLDKSSNKDPKKQKRLALILR